MAEKKKRPKPVPVESPFDEYEHMRALRCECGGALSWGERDCERLAAPRERYVLDRFTLACGACRATRPIEFLCDTGSEIYEGLAATAFGMALSLGVEGGAGLLAVTGAAPDPEADAASESGASPRRPRARRKSKAPAKRPRRRRRS